MERSNILLLFIILILPVSVNTINAQYKISSKNHAAINELAENAPTVSAEATARNFFEFAANGDRTSWETLLSKSCFPNGSPSPAVNDWYIRLHAAGSKYSVLKEGNAPRINQTVYFIDLGKSKPNENSKKLILVKEKGVWKILNAEL